MHSSNGSIFYKYEYDAHNNPICIKDRIHETTLERTYDAWNNLKSELFSNGQRVFFRHDPLGRITRFRAPDNSYVHYDYIDGHLSDIVRYSKEDKESYRHSYTKIDLQNKVLESTLIGQAGVASFSWDKKGRCSKISTPHFKEKIPESGYDAAGNLKNLTVTDPVGSVDAHFSYDDLYQLKKESGIAEHSYNNDSLSNRLDKDGKEYKLDDQNRLIKTDEAKFKYDVNGNLIERVRKDKTIYYHYDALNRLIEVLEDKVRRTKYTYDSFNRRLSKQCCSWDSKWVENSLLYFVYLGEREVGAIDSTGKMVEFRAIGRGKGAEIGASIAIEVDHELYAPIHDHRGNIIVLIDAKQGKVQETRRYTAYGERELFDAKGKSTKDSKAPWGFASKRHDKETGFVYFGKRYYSPKIGRWITPDPLGFGDGPNLYAYVHNSPLLLIDPYGLTALDDAMGAVGHVSQGIGDSMLRESEHLSPDHMPDEAELLRAQAEAPAAFEQLKNDTIGKACFAAATGVVVLVVAAPEVALTTGVYIGNSVIQMVKNLPKNISKTPASLKSGSRAGAAAKSVASINKNVAKTSKALPKDHMWRKNSPFKNKSAKELDEMFRTKGFEIKGSDPKSGKGSYINPDNERQYRIDPKYEGRYSEPNHVDVGRPEGYTGNLQKKRFGYLDD